MGLNYGDGTDPTTGYDKEGNLLALNDTVNTDSNRTFGYDPDRYVLTGSTGPFGAAYASQSLSWTYDKTGNRLTEGRTPIGTTTYGYGPDSQEEYVWLEDEPLAILRAGSTGDNGTFFLHNDHLGRPLAMTNTSGTLVWRAEYEPFGKSLPPRTNSLSFAPRFRFPGQWENRDSGDLPGGATGLLGVINALTDNWYRTYAQRWGRYTQGDPAGLQAAGGLSSLITLFGYSRNSPVLFQDPRGLVPTMGCTSEEASAIDAAVGEAARRQPSCAPCVPSRPVRQRPRWPAFFTTTYHCSPWPFAPADYRKKGWCGWDGLPNGEVTLMDVSLVDPLNKTKKCPCLPSLILEEIGHLVGFSHGDGSSKMLDRMCFPECKRWELMK